MRNPGLRACAVTAVLLVLPGGALGRQASRAEAPIRVAVDPRVELMSVIFRLAGSPEYGKGLIPSYNRDVNSHFGEHRNHPVVALAAKLRRTRGISWDAPMSLAAHITDAYTLRPRSPLEPRPAGLDGRWRAGDVREFLGEARDFVKETRFKEFFQSHQRLYSLTAERMRKVLKDSADIEWFHSFFGTIPDADFYVIIGMLTGPYCYGARFFSARSKQLYCVQGVWKLREDGTPRFDRNDVQWIAHEFCHSYVNPIVDKHAEDLKEPGERIFSSVKTNMERMAYTNWRIMICESVVRASVVRYRVRHDGWLAGESEVAAQSKSGFTWVGPLSQLLGEYEADRKRYPTFELFFPRIVEFFDRYSE